MKYNNKGIKLYKKAKKIIPGGTMLFSKNQSFIHQRIGQLIIKKQKVVTCGTLMVKNF